MTRCEKFSDRLSLLALGDLSPAETGELRQHLASCASCAAEFRGLQDLLGDLKTLPLPEVGESVFQDQQEAILDQILVEDLSRLPVAEPGEAFFASQREAIARTIEQEELEEVALISQLKNIPVPNPGDLFFRRQAKAIAKALKEEAREEREGFWNAWAKPLAVAAALFFLVLGFARVTHWEGSPGSPEWDMAMEYLAVEMEEEVGLEAIDQLDSQQLELLANNLEGTIYLESEEILVEEPVDLDDLNESELDQLIHRLEAKAQT